MSKTKDILNSLLNDDTCNTSFSFFLKKVKVFNEILKEFVYADISSYEAKDQNDAAVRLYEFKLYSKSKLPIHYDSLKLCSYVEYGDLDSGSINYLKNNVDDSDKIYEIGNIEELENYFNLILNNDVVKSKIKEMISLCKSIKK